MTRALTVAFTIVVSSWGCGESKRSPTPKPSAGSSAASEVASAGAVVISPEVAKLPGVITFAVDGTVVHLAGGARTEVTDPDAGLFPSPWRLPDGRLVAIASRGDGGAESEQLALISAGVVTRIGPAAAQVRDPAVDPRGTWIVIEAKLDPHSDLYRIEVATGNSTRLTNHPKGNFRPAVLGDAIVFVSSRDGDAEIYRMPVAGGEAQRLTAFHRDDWQPTPSPDGKTIAFLSDREGRPRVFLMSPDGTHQRRLTRRADPDRDESEPAWSPDGRSLAYLVEHGADWTLWLHDLETGTERVLTPPGARDAEPAFSPDGKWLVVSRTIGREIDLWALPTADGEPLRITADAKAERLPRWHPAP